MKNLFFATLLLLAACSGTQPTANERPSSAPGLISFKIRNNSLLPHKYTLIGYNPAETGNWTNSFVLLPGAQRTYKCHIGTKIYQADSRQVGTVMGGGNIREDKPFIIVKAEDEGKSFGLND